jgi:anti-sigma factor RsiW
LVGGISGSTLHETVCDKADIGFSIARTEMSAHTVYFAEKRHSVEVKADQKKHLFKWLSKRLGPKLYTPVLTNAGYNLVGDRLLPDGGRPAAQFMYQNSSGDRLAVYLRRDLQGEELSFRFIAEGEVSAFYWRDKSFAYALTGNIPRNKLLALAQVVHHGITPKLMIKIFAL